MNLLRVLCMLILQLSSLSAFDQVVIWGHKLHTHTHSYVHERFFRAFQHLGYPTYWFDKNDRLENFDFSKTLFLTEGQVDQGIPLRSDCQYILHNVNEAKYRRHLQDWQWINLQVYTDKLQLREDLIKIDTCIYYDIANRAVYMPWASDMLPHEIDEMKAKLPFITKEPIFHWIGTLGHGLYGNMDQIMPFARACKENSIQFKHNDPWSKGLSREESTRRISSAYLAPAIVGSWQQENGYIPCRIFINICCGQMGLTNSPRVYELFENKILYNKDTYQLFYDAKRQMPSWTLADQYGLMDFIKEKHTYLNRIQVILDFLEIIKG